MNGYQGNLEKHLQQSLFKGRSGSVSSLSNPVSYGSESKLYTPSQSSPSHSSTPPSTVGSYATPKHYPPSTLPPVPRPSDPIIWDKKDPSQLHPAIRQGYNKYNTMFHNQYQAPPTPAEYSNPAYQGQRPHHSPLAPPPMYYQPPYPLQGCSNGAPPQNPSFPQTPQMYQQSGDSQPYQPQYQPPHQATPQAQYQENKPVYAHQQYFQKPQVQAPTTYAPHPQTLAQPRPYGELPDVPADSTSLIERMMMNLRKVTSNASS
jgi:hypothetical protein